MENCLEAAARGKKDTVERPRAVTYFLPSYAQYAEDPGIALSPLRRERCGSV